MMIINMNIYNIIIDKLYYMKWLNSIQKVNEQIIEKEKNRKIYYKTVQLNFLRILIDLSSLKYS